MTTDKIDRNDVFREPWSLGMILADRFRRALVFCRSLPIEIPPSATPYIICVIGDAFHNAPMLIHREVRDGISVA
jgi:hypothetical protein